MLFGCWSSAVCLWLPLALPVASSLPPAISRPAGCRPRLSLFRLAGYRWLAARRFPPGCGTISNFPSLRLLKRSVLARNGTFRISCDLARFGKFEIVPYVALCGEFAMWQHSESSKSCQKIAAKCTKARKVPKRATRLKRAALATLMTWGLCLTRKERCQKCV